MCNNDILKQGLLVSGSFAITFVLSLVLHEGCHCIAAFLTGGICHGIYINPFSWSYAYASSPYALTFNLAGPFGSSFMALLPFYLALKYYRPVFMPFLMLGPFIQFFNGGYMLIDILMKAGGDGCALIDKGMAIFAVAVSALLLILIGLCLAILFIQKSKLDLSTFKKRFITFIIGGGPYLIAIESWNLIYNRAEALLWSVCVLIGLLSILFASFLPYRKIQMCDNYQPVLFRDITTVFIVASALIGFFLTAGLIEFK